MSDRDKKRKPKKQKGEFELSSENDAQDGRSGGGRDDFGPDDSDIEEIDGIRSGNGGRTVCARQPRCRRVRHTRRSSTTCRFHLPAIPQFLSPAPTENANIAGGEAARDPHQRWAEFTPAVTYQLEAKAGTHQFHRDYLPSYIWGFNGQYPASDGPQCLRRTVARAIQEQLAGNHLQLRHEHDYGPPAQRAYGVRKRWFCGRLLRTQDCSRTIITPMPTPALMPSGDFRKAIHAKGSTPCGFTIT